MGNKNTMTSGPNDDYAERAERFGLASKEDIQTLVKETPKGNIYFLDVRSEAEFTQKPLGGQTNVVYAQCTREDTSKVTETAEDIIQDKSAHVLVFCGVGGRAAGAVTALKELGYSNVYNIGGFKDLGYLS